MPIIRDFNVRRALLSSRVYFYIEVPDENKNQKTFSNFPTYAEMISALEEIPDVISLYHCFYQCNNLAASPNLNDISEPAGITLNTNYIFNESGIKISPQLLPRWSPGAFLDCINLLQPPTIPRGADFNTIAYFFSGCSSLLYPPSIPQQVTRANEAFLNCQNVSGEFIVRMTTASNIDDMLNGTTKPLTLYGDKTVCEAIAATATNGNAAWAPWYDPTPAVTDRGQGSFSTADDITRMVRNGALAVSSYAPGRMVYHKGDIVRADEWEALVEAAQTIDPTVTLSTHYANLNKIEKAFDDAL